MDGNTRIEELEQHLLFHRALADDDESLRRLGGYMDILSRAESGERLQDPVDESIRAVFSLVLENGMDPWEIDLSQFVRMYEAKVSSDSFDMIVAGKLLLMAWRILRMQSESTRERSEPPVEVFEEGVHQGEERAAGRGLRGGGRRQLLLRRRADVRARGLLQGGIPEGTGQAGDHVRAHRRERERVRAELRAKEPKTFQNKAHEEDDEQDIEAVWKRIEKLGTGQISIRDLYTGSLDENLTVFVSVLHLVRDGRLAVWQDDLPNGENRDQDRVDLRDHRGLPGGEDPRGGDLSWTPSARRRPRCSPVRRA